MRQYAIQRLVLAVVVIWIVMTFVFVVTRVLPGDYATQQVAQSYFQGLGGNESSEEAIQRARERIGTDKSIPEQYVRYLGDVLQGDMGRSFRFNTPALDAVTDALPYSIQLGAMSIVIALAIGVPIGVLSAVRQDTWLDTLARFVAIIGLAAPTFFTATIGTLLVLRYDLFTLDIVGHPGVWESPLRSVQLFLIPALAGGLGTGAILMRFVRSQLLDVMRQDYVRTAYSKGLNERTVIYRHALRNALIPVLTILGFVMTVMVSGSVVLETMFNIPGMGEALYTAINTRDLPVVQAMVLVITVGVVATHLVIDLMYPVIDPRIKV